MAKDVYSLVLLVAWALWKHRNRCIFDNATSQAHVLLQEVRDEANLWGLAGAKGLRQYL
ncbi:hypothetical protein PR202_ga12687 [Eleusine coracana subsp. coracana]|uniref:Uncharacterized protein n=1 Tax=Eleusine coracana subsp. coracana TaxID=191504 RepID=A0AAV5CCS7_ELECO|nr:hypothetical protein PR202_ga12687 [Eleusine coracana subsp. coracana]